MVSTVNIVTLSGKSGVSSDKAEEEGVTGAASRIRNSPVDRCGTGMAKHVTPGASSGWWGLMVMYRTDH